MFISDARAVSRTIASVLMAVALLTSACQPSSQDLATGDSVAIIGGREVVIGEVFARSIVGLYDEEKDFFCTGALLSESTVLTAAHCLESQPSALSVLFGTDLNVSEIEERAVLAFETSILWPTRQNELYARGDIAVVKFSGGLPKGYRPIGVLPEPAALVNGADVVLAGYGVNDDRQMSGAGLLRAVETEVENRAVTSGEFMVGQRSGRGQCYGDSGGPALIQHEGVWYLSGVASKVMHPAPKPMDSCHYASLYTNAAHYKTWIEEATARLSHQEPNNGN